MRGWSWGLLVAAPVLGGVPAHASTSESIPTIAIIIDDLGEQKIAGDRAIRLPGPVACAFLPHTQFGPEQATRAHAQGKEILLHLPLQPGATARAYPTAITLQTGHAEMDAYVRSALESVPFVSGVNNHQGSLLTETPMHMEWLMTELKSLGGLYFVDSRTSTNSVAFRMARARGVPAAERSIFLDDTPTEPAIRSQLDLLIAHARRNGRALAIGHPYSQTLKVLEAALPRLAAEGIQLVSPSELIRLQAGGKQAYRQLKISLDLNLLPRTPGPGSQGSTSAGAH